MIETMMDTRAMQEGLLAAREGSVRSLLVEPGSITGPVQADAESSQDVAISITQIDEAGWQRLIEAMACEAVWAAKLLEGVVPDGLEDMFRGCGTPLVPIREQVQATVQTPGRRTGWRIAALAWIAAERMHRDPLVILMIRGLSCEVLVERIGNHRALRATGESVAHPPILLDSALSAGPPLAECLDTWWRPHGQVPSVDREPHVRHALLRRLGPSTMEGRFPLSGLLATIYDDAAAEAANILDSPLQGE
jgi:uncharacterized Zn finger protein